jgi:capsular polysaccharide biosynthesis protein
MSPGNIADALLRRWYVLVAALLVTMAGAYYVLRPTPEYVGSAVVVLKPPVTQNQPNQLANLQPPLAAVSYSVVQQLQSPAGAKELRAAGVAGTYHLVPRNSGTSATPRYLIPSLQVQSQASTPEAAVTTVRRIIDVYTRHVEEIQTAQGVGPEARITATVLTSPSAAQIQGDKMRGLAGVALTGLAWGVLGALWLDRYLMGRRRAPGGRRRQPAALPVAG